MKRLAAIALAITVASFNLFGQSFPSYWNSIKESEFEMGGTRYIQPTAYETFQLDLEAMDSLLFTAPTEILGQQTESDVIFTLPDPDGEPMDFLVYYSPIMEQALADQYPEIRTYAGYAADGSYIRFDHTPQGFHAMVWPTEGGIYFIDPYSFGTLNPEYYVVYRKADHQREVPEFLNCGVDAESALDIHDIFDEQNSRYGDCQHRNYRLAISATAEYTIFHSNPNPPSVAIAQAAQVTTMNRVNGVFELELAIRMTFIANNNLIIYTNAATDPFSNGNTGAMINENQTNTDAVIGSANYDIGHIFGTNSGGLAQLNSPCGSGKARGVTGSGAPIGDPFDIDYVAHEMGHQFGANHTQNNNCNRTSTTSMEPGSAATIMGYAGICAPNVQSNSDDYFHAISLQEMGAFITGASHTCPVVTALSNGAPTVTGTPGNITVPGSTPFALTATASDPDGDAILYCWEQMDPTWATMPPVATSTAGPNFRSFDPTTDPTRYFPNLTDLATGITPTWEVISSVSRSMPFRVSVRDHAAGGGCSDHTNISVSVDATTGPFVVTNPNSTGITWTGNTNETVTWNVAGTNGGSVACANVDIFLSTDGGATYPTQLANNVANDGSQSILVPNTATTTARIMVMCEDGTFFDISDNDFTITAATFDYTLGVTSSTASVCQPTNATYTVNIGSIGGYTDLVTLSVTGVPAGAIASFGTNPVSPGGNTTLTISNTGSATPGIYALVLQGNSTSGIKTENLSLTINDGMPSAVSNSTPANGANNVAVPVTLTWAASASTPVTYTVDVATDAGFTGIVQSTSAISATSLAVSGLGTSTTYYWRVRVDNACASSAYSSTFSFTTNSCGTFASTDVPVAISSSGSPTVTSTLNVGISGAITDLNLLGLDIPHTWVNDLQITLTSPSSTTVTLVDQICGNHDNVDINFDDAGAAHNTIPCPPNDGGTYQANQALSAFNGEDPNGTWTLTVVDNANGDGGSIDAWSLEICAISNDYTLSALPATASECQGTNAVYTVTVGSIGGYSDPVTLSTSGLPAGAVATFGTNPVIPGNNTTLTISNTGTVTPGTHTFTLNGSSTSGNQAENLDLEILPNTPAVVTLLGPVNSATGVSTAPTLSWNPSATSGVTYTVQVATDAGFTSIVSNISGIIGTSQSISGLGQTTQYFWRVRTDHTCGSSAFSSVFNFTTSTCVSFASVDVPVAISNNNPGGVDQVYTSTVSVTSSGIITDVNLLDLDISHTWAADLEIVLQSPEGTTVTILDQICGNDDNFDLNFDDAGAGHGTIPCPPIGGGTYQPNSPLSAFNGESAAGTWTMTITDHASGDGGALNGWTLEVCADPCQDPTVPTLSFDDNPLCPGASTNLNISGTLNHATSWEIYSTNCGIGSVGSTSGSTLSVNPSSTTTYYVRGEGSCVIPGTCATATLTVGDAVNPTILCPGNQTLVVDGSCEASLPDYTGLATPADNCAGVTVSQSPLPTTTVSGAGTVTTITLTATDASSNTATCTFDVTLADTTPPTAICQDLTIYLDGSGNATITTVDVDGGSSDNCGTANLSINTSSFDCSDIGANTVTLTVNDGNGNSSTCTGTVTIEDTIPPTAVCQDLTVYLDGAGTATITAADVDNGSADACGINSLSVTPNSFGCANVGANTVTLTVNDNNGNSATCQATVTVVDSVSPAAVCQNLTVYLDGSGNATITAADVDNGSSDNCGSVSLGVSPSSFTCANIGANTVTLTATDGTGNSSTCTSTITVADTTPPTAICQDLTIYLDGSGNATITTADVDGGSSDNCGTANLSINTSSFDCSDIGANTVTLTVNDGNGNSSTCTGTVTIEDTIPPTAVCQDLTVYLDGAGTATITAADVDNGSADACGINSLSMSPNSFGCANVGANTVTLTVNDNNGNSATCQATVTVVDSVSPAAVCQDISVFLDGSGNASIVAADVDNGSSDNCGSPILSINTSSFDCSDIGANTVTLTVTDATGNSSTCTSTVTVADTTPPTAICQDLTIYLDGSGNATITAADVDGGSSDNCGTANLSINTSTFDCSNIGPNTVTLTVNDGNGNSSTCTGTVTIEDTIPPTAVCQDLTVYLDGAGTATITAADVDNGSADACGISGMSLDQTDFVCTDVGSNTVTLTVNDNNGNSATCQATVTVADSTQPTANCQNITVYLDNSGNASIVPLDVDNGSSDNCGVANRSLNISDFTCADVGANTVTLSIIDNEGNTTTCNSTVTVQDTISPVAVCQSISIVLDQFGNASISGTDVDAGSSDNCGIASVVVNPNNFGVGDIGANAVTLTVTDVNGNSSTCVTTVVVNDNDAPAMACQDITAYLNSSGVVTVSASEIDNGSSDPSGIASFSLSPNTFSCSNIGTNGVTLTATDTEGNSGFCSAIVTVVDTVSPVALCQNATATLDANGNATITASDVDGGSNDNCGSVTLSVSPSSFNCADVGANTVTLTATDNNGNTSACTATVTVNATLPNAAGSIIGSTYVCAGTTQTYVVPGITNAISYTWTLPAGWTGTSTTNTITVTVGTASGNVSVEGVNACGSGTASSAAVSVNDIPTAAFTFTTIGLTANFTDASTNSPTNWSWDLGDGSSSITQNPVRAYTVGGTYMVCLTATNTCGSSAPACQNVTVAGVGTYIWTGNTSTDWNTPTNWNPNGIPNGDDVIIPNVVNDPVISAGITGSVNNIDITIATPVTIAAGGELQIAGDLTWNGTNNFQGEGTVTFNGSSPQQVSGTTGFHHLHVDNTLSLINGGSVYGGLVIDGANLSTNNQLIIRSNAAGTGWIMPYLNGGGIVGDVTVQRYVQQAGFHHFGSPINTPLMQTELSEMGLSGPNGGQVIPTATCSPNVDPSSPYGKVFEWNQGNTFSTACFYWGWNVRSSGTMTNARGYAGIFNPNATLTINGTVNSGTITNPGLLNSGGTGNGFHLASNPYPSPMIWVSPVGFDGAAYFWQNSGPYSGTYQAFLSGAGHQVASMQGFFTRVSGGPANFTTTDAQRISGDPAFFRQASPLTENLEITVTGNGFADKTDLVFHPLASDKWESDLDALKVPGNADQPTIYTRNLDDLLSINSIAPVKKEKYIVLGFNCGENGDGVFDFEFKVRTDNPPIVFIEDLITGRSQQIHDGSSFQFNAKHEQDNERFLLHFYPAGSSVNNSELIIYQGNGALNISGPEEINGSILQVFDLLGQLIHTQQLISNRTEIPNQHWASGAYLIRVTGNISGSEKVRVE